MHDHSPPSAGTALDRFIEAAIEGQAVWTVAGEEGLARVPSPTAPGRMVTLLWSEPGAAERLGSAAALRPRLKRLSLADLHLEVLPRLAALGRLVGPDRGPGGSECELEPADLALRLRQAAVARFVRAACRGQAVWVLYGAEGPACLVSRSRPGAQVLPCWHARAHAEARIAGPLADCLASAVPLAAFRERMLVQLARSGRLVAPGYCEGEGAVELAPADLAARLGGAAPAEASAA